MTILQLEKERLGTTESRSPSPGIRFEEEQVNSQYFLSGPISQILPLWSYFSNTSSYFPNEFGVVHNLTTSTNLRIPHRKQSHNLSSIVLVDLNYQGTDHDLLMPLGTNCVMVHNEHHTMSMIIVFLQVISSSYCLMVCIKDHIV